MSLVLIKNKIMCMNVRFVCGIPPGPDSRVVSLSSKRRIKIAGVGTSVLTVLYVRKEYRGV